MNTIDLPFFGSNVLCFTEILEIFKHFSVSMVHVTSKVNVRRLKMINILFALSSSETKSSFWSKSFTLPVIHTGNLFSPSALFSFPCTIVVKTFLLFVSVWNRMLWNSQYQWTLPGRSFFNLVSIKVRTHRGWGVAPKFQIPYTRGGIFYPISEIYI